MNSRTHSLSRDTSDTQPSSPDVHVTFRTKVCLWIIVLGLANFLAYSVAYFALPGEAIHGGVRVEETPAGPRKHYYLLDQGSRLRVSRAKWIYSATHSTSIPITVGAVLLAMLTLAKDRILSSMRSSVVRGRTFITLLAVMVTVSSIVWMSWFLYTIITQLREPGPL
ncbi:hypothetical protein LCGC14_2521530 [marine sediment metagenome]|uniref:Uncharacterized protein n=1 Tax=marine sediment metagenome TaxID=412755 RepID=A0A0F9D7T9_9ZZZZ